MYRHRYAAYVPSAPAIESRSDKTQPKHIIEKSYPGYKR
jgi:hypothetical protein